MQGDVEREVLDLGEDRITRPREFVADLWPFVQTTTQLDGPFEILAGMLADRLDLRIEFGA